MNQRFVFALAALIFLFVTPATFSQATKAELQTMYSDFLRGEGYTPKVDEDGDVVYKAEGKTYCIIVNEKDPEFFRILFPGFWSIESEEERAKVAISASYASAQVKVAKVYVSGNNTSISAEIFINEPGDFKARFPRMMKVIVLALEQFKVKAKELGIY